MQDTLKIGAAALGGYVLGRTKKAKAALALALWLTGQGRLRDFTVNQTAKALRSERGQELLDQFGVPMVEKVKEAALAIFERQAGRAGEALQRHNDQLALALDRASRSGTNGRRPSRAQPADHGRRATNRRT
jgi:hypothetical protein